MRIDIPPLFSLPCFFHYIIFSFPIEDIIRFEGALQAASARFGAPADIMKLTSALDKVLIGICRVEQKGAKMNWVKIKIFESFLSTQILDYLLSHNLITKHQHGFIKQHSTTTNLMESLHDWSVSLSNHRSTDVAYIDFQRAFDSISHPKLIHKLSSYGISGNLLCWIKAFLTNRKQMVRINSTFSSICDVISGVPQGSVLGPMLFIIFINDITDNLDQSTTAKLFADDIKLYSELSFPHNNLQTQLDNIHTWSSIWQLNISYSKWNILHVGTKSNHTVYHISTHPINPVDYVKDLGVIVEPDLKFSRHINDIVCRANPTIIINSMLNVFLLLISKVLSIVA